MINNFSNYFNNDLRKIYLFSSSDRFSFSGIDPLIRSVSAELFQLLMPPGIFPDAIDKNLPIYNYGNKKDLQELIDKGTVDKKNVYNLPEFLINANSKIEFHKKTKDINTVPNTVFTKEKALELKFPIIAKPETGSKGEGIQVFKTKEDLLANTDEFGVFSEKFKLIKEYRVISVNGDAIYMAERRPINNKAKSLKEGKDIFDRQGTLSKRSSYDWKTVKFGKHNVPTQRIISNVCRTINEALKLEVLGIDIGIDDKGKIYVIEANTCPGLNRDQIIMIYNKIFEDFYERKLNDYSSKKLKEYQDILIKANKDDAKFSFSPHMGRMFYNYDDKIDYETGEHLGKTLLTAKYDIEKSIGDTMINIKKMHESRVLDFNTFNKLNEKAEEQDVIQIIKDIFTKKILPIEVEPSSKNDETMFSLDPIEDDETLTREEQIKIHIPNGDVSVDFTWSYEIIKGKEGSYDVPKDADMHNLTDISIEHINYYSESEGDVKIDVRPELEAIIKAYIENILPVDGNSKKYRK